MYKKTEDLLKLEHLEYDLESRKMELEGLKKEYKDFRIDIVCNVIPLIIMILFYIFTVGSYSSPGAGYSYAFYIVLSPILICIIGIYVIYLIKKLWNIYLNRNSERARKLAKKYGKRSVSEEIEKSMIDIANIEMKIEEIKDELLSENYE